MRGIILLGIAMVLIPLTVFFLLGDIAWVLVFSLLAISCVGSGLTVLWEARRLAPPVDSYYNSASYTTLTVGFPQSEPYRRYVSAWAARQRPDTSG